jgi:hypothetical protein
MPPIHGSKARMLLDGWEVTSTMRGASFPGESDVADSSTWGMTSKRYTSSDRIDGKMSGEGVHEVATAGTGSIDELLGASLTAQHVATWLPQGDGLGNRGRIIGGAKTAFELDSPGDDVTNFTFEITPTAGAAQRMRVVQPLAGALGITANGNGTSVDDLGLAGTTTKGLAGALHIINKGGGAGTITVKIQHAPDGSTWADLITFGGKTVKNVAEYLEVAGTVQRWLRAIWTVTGGTWDIHVAAGRR